MFKYVKTAFFYHWNLLVAVGGTAAAFLTGTEQVVLPLLAAGEIAYLGLLASHPRYQAYIEAQEAKVKRQVGNVDAAKTLQTITRALPREYLERFESLRRQCLDLQQIAAALQDPDHTGSSESLDHFQLAGLDRLLWIYLRLLYAQFTLSRFLQKTSESQIQADVHELEQRLKQTPSDPAQLQAQKIRKTLEDNLETSRARLENLSKARDNFQLVELEIDRLENKIRGLSEMAVNRQEPDFISGQVDEVTDSMLDAEKTMSELRFATGLTAEEETVPELLRPNSVRVTE